MSGNGDGGTGSVAPTILTRTPLRPIALFVLLSLCLGAVPALAAKRAPWRVRATREIVTAGHQVPRPGALAYDAKLDRLVVLDRAGTRALGLDRDEQVAAAAALDPELPAAHVVVDAEGRRLVAVDEARNEAVIVALGENGLPAGAPKRVRLPFVAPMRVAGVALGADGELLVLDRLSRRIVTYARARWTGEASGRQGREIAIADVGPGTLRGLAYDAAAERFYTLRMPGATLVALDRAGAVIETADLAALGLVNPVAITAAPSGDPADGPEVASLYVADAEHAAGHGAVIELALREADRAPGAAAAAGTPTTTPDYAVVPGTHVRTTRTSQWSSPSPDPTGIMYDPVRDLIVISDSEIEEMSIFAGVNTYECSRDGTLRRTGSGMAHSTEVTGFARNPADGTVFGTDDDDRCVWIIHPGADQLVGSADDTWTAYDVERFGLKDPEGVAYDAVGRRLFIADGINNRIYTFHPGEDQRFVTSDDVITYFPTGPLGIEDPEMVEYDPQRGTLFCADRNDDILELSTDGEIVGKVTTGSIAIPGAGGITIGPSSTNDGGRSFYVLCRHDAFVNDGLLVEIASTLLGPWQGGASAGDTLPPPPPPPPPSGGTFAGLAGSDDAEQRSTSVALTSSDLELVVDGSALQTVGVRFPNVTVLQGASIGQAFIQFHADESHSAPCSLVVQAHAIDSAPTFTTAASNVSSRPRTAASVTWKPPAWTSGVAGAAQRTPNLAALVQELVDRPGWESGNAIAFVITGAGTRTAAAFERGSGRGPTLTVKLNHAPEVVAGDDRTIELPATAAITATATDDGWPQPLATVWRALEGPGTVSFADSTQLATTASFAVPGTYVLQVRAHDGSRTATDELTVVVEPPNQPPAVNAGTDQTIELPAMASLAGTATDPDAKPGPLTVTWSKTTGPGTVVFAAPHALQTTATFSSPGKYVLRFAASDGALVADDEMRVSVNPENLPPTVNAGADQTITLPSGAALAGAASDDGRVAPLTVGWTKQSGPGAVTFARADTAATTASFAVDGVYVLRLTAHDGAHTVADDVRITVQPAPLSSGTYSWRVAASADDAEQGGSSGSVALTSGDLELVTDGTKVQTVGIRFRDLPLPRNATIASAWIQFTADAAHSGATTVTIQGQAIDHAPAFTTASNNVSSRARTTARATWTPSPWVLGLSGSAQRTPNLGPIVQEIVSRPGWAPGSAIAFVITGTGVRSAVSWDGDSRVAPVLHVELGTGTSTPVNAPPVVDAGPNRTVTLPASASLDGTVTDDGRVLATPALQWSKVSGPGTATFGSPNAADTPVQLSAAGTYVLRLTANDGEHTVADTVTVVASAAAVRVTVERRVAAAKDDAEEKGGAIDLNSADLELVYDGGAQQVGLRFQNLTIPKNARIVNAWVQFTVDENQTGAAAIQIHGQNADAPPEFTSSANVTSRAKTAASVAWSPAGWTEAVGAAGAAQRTPNLAPVIQEIVARAGWASGNPLVLIFSGTGHRTASAFNKAPAEAPLLHVEYE